MTISKRMLPAGLLAVTAWAQTAAPPGNPGAVEAGAQLFERHCESCHGKGGHEGRAPDLTSGHLASGARDEDLFRTISDGIPGSEMSAYAARLKPAEIRNIIAFVRSRSRAGEAPLTGDKARGEALFWGKGGCANCHAVGARGNLVGPDLSRIGRQRSVSYLRESLVNPGGDIVRGYEGLTVVTRDGKTIRGIERHRDDFSVVLQDFSGKIYSFERSSLRSVTADRSSLMPSYDGRFSPTEMNDLLAYLFTLGRTGEKP